MRIWRWVILTTIISIPLTFHAQDWMVWLYHAEDGLLVQLDADGTVLDTRITPQDEGYQTPHTIIFSHNQHLMATVAQHDTSFRQRLTLYPADSDDAIFIYELPLLPNMPFNADDQILLADNAFSTNDNRLAFVSFIGAIGWMIHVVDTTTGDLTHTLPFDHPQVIQQPDLSSADIPQIAIFQDDRIGFYINNLDGDPAIQGHSYTWFLIPDQVRENIAFPNAVYDVLGTGEVVYPLPDRRFPLENDLLPPIRLQHNAIYVYQTGDESRYPSIIRPELDLLKTHFIQGGERILIEAWEDDIRTRWLIYSRTGTEIRNMPSAGYDITPTNDGFLYLTELNDKTILVHVNTRTFDTAGDTMWVDDGDWHIVSATHTLNETLLPFARLMPDETPPPYTTAPLQPTPFPTPMSLVYVGREMQIQVFDDGYINLRDAPSTDGEVQALLEQGLYVDIVDGPVQSGIYTWWKVSLSGREGWLVEEVDGTQILIPRKAITDDAESETDN